MGEQSVSVMVEGGKATAAPPLGPALGPLGVPIGKVIEEINKQTAALKGMQVPVKILVKADKSFSLEVGKPPTAALIKKEIGKEAGSGKAGLECIASLTLEQAKKIAMAKFGSDAQPYVNQIVGTARSMGVGFENETFVKEEAIKRAEAKKKAADEAAASAAAAAASQPVAGAAQPAAEKTEKKEEPTKRKEKKGK